MARFVSGKRPNGAHGGGGGAIANREDAAAPSDCSHQPDVQARKWEELPYNGKTTRRGCLRMLRRCFTSTSSSRRPISTGNCKLGMWRQGTIVVVASVPKAPARVFRATSNMSVKQDYTCRLPGKEEMRASGRGRHRGLGALPQ